MNQGKRNIVFVGFSEREIEKIEIEDIRNQKETWKDEDFTHRFPRLIYLDTLKKVRRHQGFMLFYKMEEDFDFVKYDIQNRKRFHNYEYVFLVTENRRISNPYQVTNIAHITSKRSKIAIISFFHLAYHPSLTSSLNNVYQKYLENNQKNFSRMKLNNIEKLKTYVQGKTYIDIKKAASELNVSTKWIERYLIDMNFLYHNVGYDEEKRSFYITK